MVRSSSGSGLVELKYSSVVKSLVEADEYGNELFDSLPIIIKEEGLKHNAPRMEKNRTATLFEKFL